MKSTIIATTLASIFAVGLSACDNNRHPASDDNDTKSTALSYDKAEQNPNVNPGTEERQTITSLEQEADTSTAHTQASHNSETDMTSNTDSVNPNRDDNMPSTTDAEVGTASDTNDTASTTNTADEAAQNPNAVTNPQPTGPANS